MKRFTIITLTSLIIAITWGGEVLAQGTKEVQFSGTHYYGHIPKVYKLDENQMIINLKPLA